MRVLGYLFLLLALGFEKTTSNIAIKSKNFRLKRFELMFVKKMKSAINSENLSVIHKMQYKLMVEKIIDCAQTHRQRTNKKICLPPFTFSQLEKMIESQVQNPTGHLQKDNNLLTKRTSSSGIGCNGANCAVPVALDGIWQYGCWCNFGNYLMNGQGTPVNKHDQLCQKMQFCLRCAEIDATKEGRECNPRNTNFTIGVEASTSGNFAAECGLANPDDRCARDTCICQINIISELVNLMWEGYVYDPSYKHISEGGTFDYSENCSVQKTGGNGRECCGDYPSRTPYNAGKQSCCKGSSLFSEFSQQCCEDGSVVAIGEVC